MRTRSLPVLIVLAPLALVACEDDPASPLVGPPSVSATTLEGKHLPEGFDAAVVPPSESGPRVALSRAPATFGGELVFEPSLGLPLRHSDDDCSGFVLFPFEFFGVQYSGIWVNSNGNLTFNGCNVDWWHPDIPDGANAIIGPLYGDFNPAAGGDVFVNLRDTPPNRRFVFTWFQVPEFSPINSGRSTFQVQLFERTGEILFAYEEIGTDGFNWAFSAPSVDAAMDVGISSGTGDFIKTASGGAIPALEGGNICYIPVGDGYAEVFGPCVLPVAIDVRPGSDVNPVNVSSRGVIPVAILGSASFDIGFVARATIRFGDVDDGEYALAAHGPEPGHVEDVNGDGLDDLLLHFPTRDTGIDPDDSEVCLVGETTGGSSLRGCDTIKVVAPRR